jgi:hypothetical protein
VVELPHPPSPYAGRAVLLPGPLGAHPMIPRPASASVCPAPECVCAVVWGEIRVTIPKQQVAPRRARACSGANPIGRI